MSRRFVRAKPGQLVARFGKADRWDKPAIQYAYGGAGAGRSEGRILSDALEGVGIHDGKTLAQLLEERGFDMSTLSFSVQMKDPADV
ncbi:hypothetical protein ASE63_22595 [Bosea sp. Root381]|uniref:hypothetical protein n=1 Tax=Bosea sp. Root381 TaxID=1736524 RepID=UPI0006FC94D9|nr:hypothetical protein [Bosea sp. Root381]KRE07491.1 hypothetical protein ASE63_22595 [Bosea sp. Root381]